MENMNNRLKDQHKKKEKLHEYTLEEGEIYKFPKSRFLHNKIIITDDNTKNKDSKENLNIQIKSQEETNKIENPEIKENTNSDFKINENKNNHIDKISSVHNSNDSNNPLVSSKEVIVDYLELLQQIKFEETINNKKNKEECLEKLTNQDNIVDNTQKEFVNEINVQQAEVNNELVKEELRGSRVFSIPMDLDRETFNIKINDRSPLEYKLEKEYLIDNKVENKMEEEISVLYSSEKLEEKEKLIDLKTGKLTENQIMENKELLNNKNFLINNLSPNSNEAKKNYIKIKILDFENKAVKESENQIEKEKKKNINNSNEKNKPSNESVPRDINILEIFKNKDLNLPNKEAIVNIPIIEPIAETKNELLEENKMLSSDHSTPGKKNSIIHNSENKNIIYNQISIAERKPNYSKDSNESDKDIISNLISYKNPVILKAGTNKNLDYSAEKLISNNNSASSKNEINKKNNDNNDNYNSNQKQANSKQESNKEQQNIGEELTCENQEEKFENIASKDKIVPNKDKEKYKKNSSKKSEKKVSSKVCIYCKVEITDPSTLLKFKSSDDFLTYCKLFFEKLPPQKKEVYDKSIVSFEKYYTEKYSNFEQINNIIFKSIKSICKLCYEENIKEENGFINILAALNYNIIINNKRNIMTMLPKNNNNYYKKEELSLELYENNNNFNNNNSFSNLIKSNKVENQKVISHENNKDLCLSTNNNNNLTAKSNKIYNKPYEIENSQISVENYSSMKNLANAKRENIIAYEFEKQRVSKKNIKNSDLESCNTDQKPNDPSSAYILNNELLGRKINRSEQELMAIMQQKKPNFYVNNKMHSSNNPEKIESVYLNRNNSLSTAYNSNPNLINNTHNDNKMIEESHNRNFTHSKEINSDANLANKNSLNSNLNMNTKNISLENLNITNVFMNFDQKKGLKPILIDSKVSKNNNELLLNNNKQAKVNLNNSNSIENNQNIFEDLKKSYIDLNNCSLEKKLFLNSLQKKSEILITNLTEFDRNKLQTIKDEHNNISKNNELLENEKKNFALNNSKQMGLLMNLINQQLEENKNIIYPPQNVELKEITKVSHIGSLMDQHKTDNDNNNTNDNNHQQVYQQQYLNNKISVGNEFDGIINYNNNNNNNQSSAMNINNNNSNANYNNFMLGNNNRTLNALNGNENFNLNNNQENNQMMIVNAHKSSSNAEREIYSKNPNKTNLIDRILNLNSNNSKNVSNSNSNKQISENANLIELSAKNLITISEEASNRNNNNHMINNRIQDKSIQESVDLHKKLEENLNNMNNYNNNNNNLLQQNNLNHLLSGLLSSPSAGLGNNIHNLTLQQMLLNQNQALTSNNNLNKNNNPNTNSQLQSNSSQNNNNNNNNSQLGVANLTENKKQLSDQNALGNLNFSNQNLLLAQNNQLLNQTLSGMVHNNALNFGLAQTTLLPGMQSIPNIQAQLNQQLSSLNPLLLMNQNLLANLDPTHQAFLVQNNLLNHQNQMDLSVLGLNNPLMQLQLPLHYQLQMQINPALGLPLSIPLQIQNQQLQQLGNLGNIQQLNTLNQLELLNRLNMGGAQNNLQAIQQQQQQMNILKSNNPLQHHLIQAGNPIEFSMQQQQHQPNLLKGVNSGGNNNSSIRSQELANTLNQLSQFEKSHLQGQQDPHNLSMQLEQNKIHNQLGLELNLKNQEHNRNLLNPNLSDANNQINLNFNQMMMQNGQNNLIYNQALLNQLNNQNLNFMNAKMHPEE